eukprot:TRINITY_DN56573_c0_g1_i1.p1 TRINITY_DN56573_c0_g1~~TRINITY_DN56573_c0_g1_i1.p1  ORF type:complete len:180 (-),score=14.39 TRINITY_DN56573_c0_g1_i1:139-678(-)
MTDLLHLFNPHWYIDTAHAVSELVEDPRYRKPKVSQEVLQILLRGAVLHPLPQQIHPTGQTFVRVIIDEAVVGETSMAQASDQPVWNERLLVLPQNASWIRFDVCEVIQGFTIVRCGVAFQVESLWETVCNCGKFVPEPQALMHLSRDGPIPVGELYMEFALWDGMALRPGSQVTAAPL